MTLSSEQLHSWQGLELGALGLCALNPIVAENMLRVVSWSNGLARLGITPPLFLIYDLGVSMSSTSGDPLVEPRKDIINNLAEESRKTLKEYAELIEEIGATEVAERARGWKLSEDLITVILAKLLGDLWSQWNEPLKRPALQELPLEAALYENLEPQLLTAFKAHNRELELKLCRYITENRLRLITLVEGIDLDTLRLLGLFRSGDRMAGIVDVTDLLGVLNTPQANDIVNFSLDVIPSMLETKRSSGMQTFSVDGYAGLARTGHIDSLLLSELAHDDIVFEQRFIDNELFYYAHEKQSEQVRRLHYIALDASASMRGEREVFARGLALALVKKLSLMGEDVYLRFFDSMLYDLVRTKGEQFDVPYLLCFRSERGRNYSKVFKMLSVELQRISTREHRRPILYVITHAECHIPEDVLEQLKRFAYVYGVFILPSTGELDLQYIDQLDHHHVIDRETLLDRDARTDKALEICEDAAGFATKKRPH